METCEVKQRQRSSFRGKHRKTSEDEIEREEPLKKTTRLVGEEQKTAVNVTSRGFEGKPVILCFCIALLLSWLHLQQYVKLEEMREKYDNLFEQSQGIQEIKDQIKQLSLQFPHPERLDSEGDRSSQVDDLSFRFSSLSSHQEEIQQRISMLAQALEESEQRRTLIISDTAHRASTIRTDLRRMDGLATDVQLLLNQTLTLEEKLSMNNKLMVRRIGDALAASIDRVSGVKSTVETQSRRLEEAEKLAQELTAGSRKLEDRMFGLESGRAKLIKMAAFTQELKPKVWSIRQEMVMMESRIDHLTLRIGELAEDMRRREEEGEQQKIND